MLLYLIACIFKTPEYLVQLGIHVNVNLFLNKTVTYGNISRYCCVACFLRIACLVWSFITG